MTNEDSQTGQNLQATGKPGRHGHRIGGIVLVVLGVLLLLERFVPEIQLSDYWPLILIAIGGALLLKRRSSS